MRRPAHDRRTPGAVLRLFWNAEWQRLRLTGPPRGLAAGSAGSRLQRWARFALLPHSVVRLVSLVADFTAYKNTAQNKSMRARWARWLLVSYVLAASYCRSPWAAPWLAFSRLAFSIGRDSKIRRTGARWSAAVGFITPMRRSLLAGSAPGLGYTRPDALCRALSGSLVTSH